MHIMSNVTRSLVRPLALWLAWPSLFACGTDSLKPSVPVEPRDAYWILSLNHHAVTMGPQATYDTLTIVATPRNAAGEALTGLPAPTYVSRDLTKVSVTPEGLVRVIESGFEPVWVVATLVTGNVRHVDSVRVRSVDVDPPPVLTMFSIKPVPPDSAKVALSFPGPSLPVRAVDVNGLPLTDLMVSFRSLDPNVATIDEVTGAIGATSMGDVTFTASTTMFHVTKVDTVRYRIGWPLVTVADVSPVYAAAVDTFSARVGVGALVIWAIAPKFVGEGYSIDFDDADLPNIREGTASITFATGWAFICSFNHLECISGGNVVVTPPNVGAGRAFTAPGTYHYHIRPQGIVGRVEVIDER